MNDTPAQPASKRRRRAQPAGSEADRILRWYRARVLEALEQAGADLESLGAFAPLLRPVIAWARVEEQRRDREAALTKHREQLAAHAARNLTPAGEARQAPESLAEAERELQLMVGAEP